LAYSNFMKGAGLGWFTSQEVAKTIQDYDSIWNNIRFHVPAHLFMIHGLIPKAILPASSYAFLKPAWSLSLEWQFYLIAPLWIYFLTSKSVWKRLLMYAVCMGVILVSRRFLWLVQMESALPFQVEFFFFGMACYLLYRSLTKIEIKGDTVFPMVFIFCLAIYKWSGRDLGLIPFLVWASLFALIIEPASSISSRYISPFLTNRISLWLGKISFSIYLCHMLVLNVAQWSLLEVLPGATQMQHLLMLSLLTFGFTILLSAVLYYCVEAPFIKLGKRLTHEST
jgi:peptidoglycan/LPS O-acetylase OafA/YrhL